MTSRRYALVTGASSGIGAAFARLAVREDCDVGLVARRIDRLETLAIELRGSGAAVDVLRADLSTAGAGEALAERVRGLGRGVDILVNNAGATLTKGFAGTALADQHAFINLTMVTPVALIHAVLPAMLERRFGRIINVGSIASLSSGAKGNTLYPAGKSFLLKFSQSLNA
ncbi:MAG: SDR family NAD(P)-dependent oxidoreductase, partial [Rhodospirillales bacterium]|nr:SDR family NAD(P)-dependent oxidoreductase [Rhodospirillales bacterium]